MADEKLYISSVQLPSNGKYYIKDEEAREAIAALGSPTHFAGQTSTALTDGATTTPITIDGNSYTPNSGDVVVNGNKEFIFDGTKWIELGDTTNLGALAYKDSVTLNKGTADNVLGEATTFKAAASSVTFTGGTTDKVLGSSATFTTTVTPTTTNIKATASGAAVAADGTASVITGYASPSTSSTLGSNATFTTTVTPSIAKIKATASGTTVAANGTAAAITGFGTHSTETFVKSVSADTTKKLVTTTIPNVTGNTNVTIPNVTSVGTASSWSFAMGSGDNAETLIISGGNSTTPTLGTALSASKVTLGTAKTVATGAATTDGTGAAVVTDVTIGDSATAITALGTPTTSNCLTGVKVTAQPTIALATGATGTTGVVEVATGISSASTVTNNKDAVAAITGLGDPSTETVLTGVKVTAQPTITLATGATAGTGVISVATGITSASTTTNNKDEVTAVTNVGTGTAAAQTITVGTNDKVKVAKYDDLSVSVS